MARGSPTRPPTCSADRSRLDAVHPDLPAARARLPVVEEPIRAPAAELGGAKMPDAAEHAGYPTARPADRVLDLRKRPRLVWRAGQGVQQLTHQVAATVMEARDLLRIVHRVLRGVLRAPRCQLTGHLPSGGGQSSAGARSGWTIIAAR